MGAPFRLTATLFSIAGIASATVAANPTPTPTADVVRDTINRYVRVKTIVRRITAANVATCPTKRGDFGFTSVSPNPDASASVRAAWTEGLGLGDGSTVVAVYGSGPAEAAGLRVETDLRNEKIGYKVREHSLSKVPLIIAVGNRDAEGRTVSVRRLGSQEQTVLSLTDAITSFADEAKAPG